MSRIGKIPVNISKEIKVSIASNNIHLENSKGKLDLPLPSGIKVEQKDDKLIVSRTSDDKQTRANHGTIRAYLVNMVEGLTKGHKKELEIQGVGFRAQLQGKKILMNLGFSHPVEYDVPGDVKISVPTQTNIIIEGADLMRVGQVAAQLRALKPAEPYKGKGFRYAGEIVRRKQGKSVTK
jgi:large subunit ribosomal protein L6